MVRNSQVRIAWTFNDMRSIMANTWQEACIARKLRPTTIPNGWWCNSDSGNAIYVQSGEICADGDYKIPMPGPSGSRCGDLLPSCPSSAWTLSQDKKTCTRKDVPCPGMEELRALVGRMCATGDDACWKNLEHVTEVKLLAAIAYGEASVANVYQEMAGIASATIRRRDAAKFSSVNALVKKHRTFSYVVYNGNARFVKLMCAAHESEFKDAYAAAANAISYGTDYANGGCFWDGYDLKTSGVNHDKGL